MHCLESTLSAGATAQKPNLPISLPGVVYNTTAGKGLSEVFETMLSFFHAGFEAMPVPRPTTMHVQSLST